MPILIDPDKCPKNHRCPLIGLCPMEAVGQQGSGLPEIDAEKCIECEICVRHCARKAVYRTGRS